MEEPKEVYHFPKEGLYLSFARELGGLVINGKPCNESLTDMEAMSHI